MKDILKKIFSNRVGLAVLAFIVGGIVTSLFLPEKIKIEKEIEVVEVEKIIEKEVVKWKEKIVEVEKEVKIKEKVTKQKVTYPDGKIVETEIYESESEQIDRIRDLERERYNEILVQRESEFKRKEKELKEIYNPKRFIIYGGVGTAVDSLTELPHYLVGTQYTLWGPITIGIQADSESRIAGTVGIRF